MAGKVYGTLGLLALVGALYYTYERRSKKPVAVIHKDCCPVRVPVAINRSPDVLDGFRGEVHPILRRPVEMKVAATWRFDRQQDRDPSFLQSAPPVIRDFFLGLEVSIPSKSYTEKEFSRFMPANDFGAVGQMWALDTDKLAECLKQFHALPSMHLVAKGRRAGPDGAFAILRAASPSHADILFRIHAEFDVMPDAFKKHWPDAEAWYSPACFLGRMVVNRTTGAVEYFWLGLPKDGRYNVHVSVAKTVDNALHGWMQIDQMDLVGGNKEAVHAIRWVDQIDTVDAQDRLTKIFHTFKNINWVSFEQVAAEARRQKKPMFLVVALGALDDQTC